MNIVETRKFIAGCDLANLAPLIRGKHGIGKSDVIRQYAKDNNMHCEVLILSLMDVGDLIGLPRTTEVGGQLSTTWAAPQWFNNIIDAAWANEVNFEDLTFKDSALKELVHAHTVERSSSIISRGDLNHLYCRYNNLSETGLYLHTQSDVTWAHSRRSVLFLDEFNRAPIDILNASLQLILDKRLHSHILPSFDGKPTFTIAAINPSDEDYTVNTFDPALLDRFVDGEIEADATAWLEWARDNELPQVVRDFIAEHKDRIHYTPADGGVGATPRSWTMLSRVMGQIDNIPREVQFQLMKGTIGQEVASQFLAYYNNYFKVVKLEDIEKLVKTKHKSTSKIETTAKHVAKVIKDQEVIQKNELAETLFKKYVGKDAATAAPLMAYLYALELEILNGFLKKKQSEDSANYMKLAELDGTVNNKGLFKKIASKVVTK